MERTIIKVDKAAQLTSPVEAEVSHECILSVAVPTLPVSEVEVWENPF